MFPASHSCRQTTTLASPLEQSPSSSLALSSHHNSRSLVVPPALRHLLTSRLNESPLRVANTQLPSCIWPAEPPEAPPIWRHGLGLPRGRLSVPFLANTSPSTPLPLSIRFLQRGRLMLTGPTSLACLVPPHLWAAAAKVRRGAQLAPTHPGSN
jgi:hypothetical protein